MSRKTKTEAPTSGITKDATELSLERQGMLSEDEFDFVNLLHQHYSIHGELLTATEALNQFGLPLEAYKRFWNKPLVQAAVGERNIPTGAMDDVVIGEEWRSNVLSARQILVADTMLDLLDRRSYNKKLQDLDVKTTEWQAWLKEPNFAKYLDENANAILKNGQHEAALALMDKVSQGDLKAIQFYWEYTGRFVSKTSGVTSPQADAFDAKRIIQAIVEIIIDEVEDHDTAARISDRMKTLISAVQITEGLVNPPPVGLTEIAKPEVVPTRELTPAMAKAVDQGIGMET